jgi:hypothetical protein
MASNRNHFDDWQKLLTALATLLAAVTGVIAAGNGAGWW